MIVMHRTQKEYDVHVLISYIYKLSACDFLSTNRIGESMCEPDKNLCTPIIAALLGYELKEMTRDLSVKVVFEILSYLATLDTDCSKCIEAIKEHKYQGLPVIEYDIKSGYDQGIIIQVSSALITIFKHNLLLCTVYHIAGFCHG